MRGNQINVFQCYVALGPRGGAAVEMVFDSPLLAIRIHTNLRNFTDSSERVTAEHRHCTGPSKKS